MDKHPHLSLRVHYSEDPHSGLLEDVDVAVYFGTGSPPGSCAECAPHFR